MTINNLKLRANINISAYNRDFPYSIWKRRLVNQRICNHPHYRLQAKTPYTQYSISPRNKITYNFNEIDPYAYNAKYISWDRLYRSRRDNIFINHFQYKNKFF